MILFGQIRSLIFHYKLKQQFDYYDRREYLCYDKIESCREVQNQSETDHRPKGQPENQSKTNPTCPETKTLIRARISHVSFS